MAKSKWARSVVDTFDHLYIGWGNAKRITFEPDPDVTIVGNTAGIEGGLAAWHD